LTDQSIKARTSTAPGIHCLARPEAVDYKVGQCAQTLRVAACTGAELNALHRHLQEGGRFPGVDSRVDFSALLSFADPIGQAFEKRMPCLISQDHKLRIGASEFTNCTDTHAPERAFAVVFGNKAKQKRLNTA
jgi:hypothetical protein